MSLKSFLFILVFTLVLPSTGHAQAKITAIVNDDVISEFDLKQRIKFAELTSTQKINPKELREIVLKQLIDEKLKLQEAQRLGLTVNPEELQHALETTIRQNGMDVGKFMEMMKKNGLPMSVLEDQIKSELLFFNALRKTAQQRSEISDIEIDTRMKELTNQTTEKQYLLSEIFLPVANEQEDGAAYGQAVQIIMNLRKGIPFEKLAETYSKSSSAAKGGLLGWVSESALEPQIKEELELMESGQITTPMKTADGYTVMAIRAIRSPEDLKEQDAYRIAQIFLPNKNAQDRKRILQDINMTKGSCKQFIELAKKQKETPRIELGVIPLKDIPPQILNAVKKSGLLKPTDPLPIDGGELIFMACSKEKVSPLPTKDDIRKQIENQRLEMMAARKLRELRRSAITEMRQ